MRTQKAFLETKDGKFGTVTILENSFSKGQHLIKFIWGSGTKEVINFLDLKYFYYQMT